MEIRKELLTKAKREYKGFIAYVNGTSTERAIDYALEIVVKQELLDILEHEKELTDETMEIINRFYIPLDTIFSEWHSRNTSVNRDDLVRAVKELARTNMSYKTPDDGIDLDAYEREKEEYFGSSEDDDDMEM